MISPHTPGPWSLPHFAEPGINCNCGYVLSDTQMGAIATVHCSGLGDFRATGDNPRYSEAVANARLIAAAPDMLAALQIASVSCGFQRLNTAAQKIVLQAIAKATGSTHD